jgi:beta-mannosidase
MTRIDLCGAWRFKSLNDPDWMEASVPGTVLSDLLAHGAIPDPFIADHEFVACEQTRKDWIYARDFDLDAETLAMEHLVLHAEGLMTQVKVSLNGTLLGSCDNMHRWWEWDIRELSREGTNHLELHFASSLAHAEARQRECPTWSVNGVPGFQHVRQSHHTFGWDWGPVLPDMGIFRPVRVTAWSGYRLERCYVRQHHREGRVDLEILIHLDRAANHVVYALALLQSPSGAAPVEAGGVFEPGQPPAPCESRSMNRNSGGPPGWEGNRSTVWTWQ